MSKHTEKGYSILAGSESNLLELAATIALSHHERYDGAGYPKGLAGEDIPIEGRIAAVADVFDALTNKEIYNVAFSVDEAFDILRKESGSSFDPQVVEALIDGADEVKNIMKEFARHRTS